jgi:hypothetical protein
MKNNKTGVMVDIVEHIITRNFWEFYIIDGENIETPTAWVMGFEDEMGPISMKEIMPHIITRTKKLDDVMPAKHWSWVKPKDKDNG